MIEARDLVKQYRMGQVTLQALRGVSFQVETGSFVAIVGPSGAGKSTLLHLLAGLDSPTKGEVLWEGQALSSISDAKRSMLRNRMLGVVFQSYHLMSELSALENVMLPGLVNGQATLRQLRERGLSCLEQVGLAHRIQHRPQQLSGGEQQRVAIARALVNRPRVLLCDEPSGNLDSATGEEIANLLIRFCEQERVSLILVTHDTRFSSRAHRILVMRDGQIVSDGPVSESHK